MMAAATTATARRATGFVLTVALAVCSCGGGALGFVLPSAASTAAAAPARGKAGGTHDLTAMYCCQSPSPLFAHTLFHRGEAFVTGVRPYRVSFASRLRQSMPCVGLRCCSNDNARAHTCVKAKTLVRVSVR